ncbi:MAG TPA: hypothetical protein VN903_24895 [Polyangia bacterium]|nr:hypothetical protein [Polyangia bacterium]
MPGIESSGPATTPGNNLSIAIATLGAAGGTVIIPPGTWVWESVPALPKNLTGQLKIVGAPGATIQLTAAAPRFLDFNKTAAGDTFQNIEISDLTIDANNIGGIQHVIIGTRSPGTQMTDINLQSIAVRRIRAINIYTDPAGVGTNNRLGVWFVVGRSAVGNFTIKDILVEDVRLEGGASGVVVAGQNPSANAPVDIDRVVISRCYHDTGVAPNLVGASNNFQIGGYATGRGGHIIDCYGNRCGDAGLEIDIGDCLVERTQIDNGLGSNFFVTLFSQQTNPGEQSVVFRKCSSRVTDAGSASANSFGWSIRTSASTIALPHVKILDCEYMKDLSIHNATGTLLGGAIYRDDTGGLPSPQAPTYLDIERFKVTFLTGTNSNNSTFTPFRILTNTGTTSPVFIKFRDIYVNSTYTKGSGTMTWVDVEVTGGGIYLDIDGFFTVSNFTSFLNGNHRLIRMGNTTTTLVGCRIRRMVPLVEAAPQTRGITFVGANITFAKIPATIENCDFQKLTATFELDNSSAGMAPKTRMKNNVWATTPAPVGLTGLVTATGKQLGTVWDASATFTQGSGTAITAIDYSTDGGTTYTNFLTQGSGALPAGFGQSIGPLASDALIKVTFTGTQPTITLVPVNP